MIVIVTRNWAYELAAMHRRSRRWRLESLEAEKIPLTWRRNIWHTDSCSATTIISLAWVFSAHWSNYRVLWYFSDLVSGWASSSTSEFQIEGMSLLLCLPYFMSIQCWWWILCSFVIVGQPILHVEHWSSIRWSLVIMNVKPECAKVGIYGDAGIFESDFCSSHFFDYVYDTRLLPLSLW